MTREVEPNVDTVEMKFFNCPVYQFDSAQSKITENIKGCLALQVRDREEVV